jgi:ribulose-5-phosphate 4-epimerase/fuculose-1-phosphate aldolase
MLFEGAALAGARPSTQAPAPPSAPRDLAQVIAELVAANRVLAKQDVVDAFGHVSVRHPRMREHFLLSRSLAPALVEPGDILEYDFDGKPLDAQRMPSYRERFIHGEIYRVRQDVNAIIHCHTPSLIPFSVTGVALRPVYAPAAFIAEGIPVFEIRAAGGMTNLLIESPALGRALAQTLGHKPAALMRGHGAVVVADSIPSVVGRSVYLAMNARLQAQALALGGQITYVDPEEARLYLAQSNYDRAWELWRKEVNR